VRSCCPSGTKTIRHRRASHHPSAYGHVPILVDDGVKDSERELIQEVQLGLGLFQRLKSGLQMRRFEIVEVRPAKHVVDDRFGRLNPFLRPTQDGQRKRPSGRIAVDAGTRGGHD
jgi:hypothetical protein